MAKAGVTKHYNNFLNGKVSDGNEFTAPENAVKDMLNVELLQDGSLRKRRGLSFDDDPVSWDVLGTGQSVMDTVDWSAAESGGDYALVSNGTKVNAYSKAHSSGKMSNGYRAQFSPNTGTVLTSSTALRSWMFHHGFAVAVQEGYYPQIITNPSTSTFNVDNFEPQVRDLEGVDDGFDVEENPSTAYHTFSVIAFATGELLTGTTSGFKAYALSNAGIVSLLYVGDNGFTNGEAVTGSGGGTGTIGVESVANGLTDEHYYNLLNQGWTWENIKLYAEGTLQIPSNAQIMSAGKDSSGDFDQPTLDKIFFGSSPAAKGKFIINPITNIRTYTDPIQGGEVTVTSVDINGGFKTCALFASRMVMAGGFRRKFQDKVFVSQLLTTDQTDPAASNFQLNKFHSVNDLTAEELNDTLPTDGFTFTVDGAVDIQKVVPLGKGLMILAKNGIWFMRGTDVGFTSQDFEVVRVSTDGCFNPGSSVVGKDAVYYWGDSGIHGVVVDVTGLSVKTGDLADNRISAEYREFTSAEKRGVRGHFDPYRQQVLWAYNSGEAEWPSYANSNRFDRRKVIIFDIKTGAFTFQDMNLGSGSLLSGTSYHIAGFTFDANIVDANNIPSRIPALIERTATTTQSTFGLLNSDSLYDWGDTDAEFDAYIEGWDEHLGEPHLDKGIDYVISFFRRTEQSFVDNGSGGVEFDQPSSALLSAKWEWTDEEDAGRWTAAQQAYKFLRPYVSGAIGDPFDYGFKVIKTKLEIGGKGAAVALRYDAEAGKDMHLIGYSVSYNGVSAP